MSKHANVIYVELSNSADCNLFRRETDERIISDDDQIDVHWNCLTSNNLQFPDVLRVECCRLFRLVRLANHMIHEHYPI